MAVKKTFYVTTYGDKLFVTDNRFADRCILGDVLTRCTRAAFADEMTHLMPISFDPDFVTRITLTQAKKNAQYAAVLAQWNNRPEDHIIR